MEVVIVESSRWVLGMFEDRAYNVLGPRDEERKIEDKFYLWKIRNIVQEKQVWRKKKIKSLVLAI